MVDEASALNFSNLGLHADLAELRPTLAICKDRLRILDLSSNGGIHGTLEVVSMCKNLGTLKLEGCGRLTGTFGGESVAALQRQRGPSLTGGYR